MFTLRLLLALALVALAAPLRAEPWPASRHARIHGPHRAFRHHGRFHHGFFFPPPYQPFPPVFPEPLSAPPPGLEISPPAHHKGAARGAPAHVAPFALPLALPQGMAITVRKELHEHGEGGARSSPLIERPLQAAAQLAACWSPPLPREGETVEATIRFSFNRRGTIIGGAPRVTYVKAGAGQSAEEVRASILAAVRDCTPLRFSASMAESAPGYPLSIRFIGRRPDAQERPK
jgi:hypothetical protein